FPSTSNKCHAFAAFVPTARGPFPPLFSSYQATEPKAASEGDESPDRAAYSHSSSEGSRPPTHLQKPAASSQVSITIGESSFFHSGFHCDWGGMPTPVSAANRLYAATLTSVWPIQNPIGISTL